MIKDIRLYANFCLLFLLITSCKQGDKAPAKEPVEEKTEIVGTPVTLTSPQHGNMTDAVELNAVSAFLLKTFVKANANGYLQIANAQLGKFVTKG